MLVVDIDPAPDRLEIEAQPVAGYPALQLAGEGLLVVKGADDHIVLLLEQERQRRFRREPCPFDRHDAFPRLPSKTSNCRTIIL